MRLIGGVPYRVTVVFPKDIRYVTVTLDYCGGGQVDREGHHVAGGIWAAGDHPNVKYFEYLTVVGIQHTPNERSYAWADTRIEHFDDSAGSEWDGPLYLDFFHHGVKYEVILEVSASSSLKINDADALYYDDAEKIDAEIHAMTGIRLNDWCKIAERSAKRKEKKSHENKKV